MKKTVIIAAIFLLGPAWPASAGTKEELQRLQRDILQLQELIRTMKDSQDRSAGVLQSLLEQLNDKVAESNSSLDGLAEALRQRGEQQRVQADEWKRQFQRLVVKIDDTNNRIAALQQKLEDAQMKIQSVRSATPDLGATPEPDRVYSAAYNDYLMGNYDLAVAAFRDFLINFPESEYSDNAAYYMGVSHLEQQRQEAAIQAFNELINLYPDGDKLPQARFKKATALLQLQRRQEAIETLQELVKLHPESTEANLAKNELQRLGVETSR